jgi:hypothetical protein
VDFRVSVNVAQPGSEPKYTNRDYNNLDLYLWRLLSIIVCKTFDKPKVLHP